MADRIYYSKEAERLARRRQTQRALAFIGLGLGLGAVLALLFAPEDGRRTRELIADALEVGFNRGREAATEALRQAEQEYPAVRRKVETLLSNVTS